MTSTLKGIFIPIEILSIENLSIQEKIILSLVKIMPSGLQMTNEDIGSILLLSKGRVSHIITKLVRENYLDIKLIKRTAKTVEKRILTIKATLQNAVEKVKEVASKVVSKAKEIKQQYVNSEYAVDKAVVGTEEVEQLAFCQSHYKTPNSNYAKKSQGHKKPKNSRFTNIMSHNWDMEELEHLEQEHVDNQTTEFNLEELQKKLKER